MLHLITKKKAIDEASSNIISMTEMSFDVNKNKNWRQYFSTLKLCQDTLCCFDTFGSGPPTEFESLLLVCLKDRRLTIGSTQTRCLKLRIFGSRWLVFPPRS
jgi:hypothetical protein